MINKLTVCKTCGEKIAKSARVCPHCGAKQHQGVLAFGYALLTISLILLFYGIFVAIDNHNAPVAQDGNISGSPEQPEIINVSASHLMSAYEANTVQADELYKNKIVAVNGTVQDITQDMVSKDPCVLLESGNALYPVQCFFSESESESVSQLSDGDEINIIGKCTGLFVAQIQISNCSIQ